jgi:hypothetical protein
MEAKIMSQDRWMKKILCIEGQPDKDKKVFMTSPCCGAPIISEGSNAMGFYMGYVPTCRCCGKEVKILNDTRYCCEKESELNMEKGEWKEESRRQVIRL